MSNLSVVMATYNEQLTFLKTCINSILSQTLEDFEFFIVVEPQEKNLVFLREIASKDNRIKIVENETRLGVAGSRNTGFLKCSGKYIAIIDGDDYCAPERFERQFQLLEENQRVNVVGTNMWLVDGDGNIVGERTYPESHLEIKRSFLLTMAVGNPTLMIRRRDLKEVGLFDSNLIKAEDIELWLRFLAHGMIMHNLQENLLYYRVQKKNERRDKVHYRNHYAARRRHSKFIWPWHERLFSLSMYFIISHIPHSYLQHLLALGIVDKMKRIRRIVH
jgi:glycosyltransferase involved in cell wall biosynthesis